VNVDSQVNRTTSPVARCLSIHAGYRCRHAGACCTAGWEIPAEAPVVDAVSRRFGNRGELFRPDRAPDGSAVLALRGDRSCVFFDAAHGRLCEIHRDLGEGLLPSACRHFPRVVLRDRRGTFVTLSHFCPTAASLLVPNEPVSIVEAPASLTLNGTVEGLDARDVLPPLLRTNMLADVDGFAAWENAFLDLLQAGDTADEALGAAARTTRRIAAWTPGARQPLRDMVADEFARPIAGSTSNLWQPGDRLAALALSSVPGGLALPDVLTAARAPSGDPAAAWRAGDGIVRRYLMSKIFGNWWPYFGLDLCGVVRAIEAHAVILKRQLARHLAARGEQGALLEAIRDTDLLMVHLVDFATFAGAIRGDL
jgi:Fe-S-cluster containining protein